MLQSCSIMIARWHVLNISANYTLDLNHVQGEAAEKIIHILINNW